VTPQTGIYCPQGFFRGELNKAQIGEGFADRRAKQLLGRGNGLGGKSLDRLEKKKGERTFQRVWGDLLGSHAMSNQKNIRDSKKTKDPNCRRREGTLGSLYFRTLGPRLERQRRT